MFNARYLANVLPASDDDTVKRLQSKLVEFAEDGSLCPCCGQRVRVYRRKLTSAMAHFLILFAHAEMASPEPWLSISSIRGVRGGDYAKLRFWRLIEQKPLEPGEQTQSGTTAMWRLTNTGWDYVRRDIALPSHVFVYDNNYLGPAGKYKTIDAALGDKFDYHELTGQNRR